MSEPRSGRAGARRGTRAPGRRRPWWLWLVLGLLVLGALLLVLARCGTSGADPTGTGTTSEAAGPAPTTTPVPDPTATPGASTGAPGSGARPGSATTSGNNAPPDGGPSSGAATGSPPGSLTADGAALLPVAQVTGPDGELTSQAGAIVIAGGVPVESVAADEGFWIGTSETDRVWVQLTGGADESPYTVVPGDLVEFTGQMVAHDTGFAAGVGVDPGEGADQLVAQAAHIDVSQPDLRGVTG